MEKEILEIIAYKVDVQEELQSAINSSFLEVTYVDHTKESTPALSFVKRALHKAITNEDEYLLRKVIEFGVVELLTDVVTRNKYYDYRYGKKQKTKSIATQQKQLRTWNAVKYYLERGCSLTGGRNTESALYKAAEDNAINEKTASDHYYAQESENKLAAELSKNTVSLNGSDSKFYTDKYYDLKVKEIITKELKKRSKPTLEEAVTKASLELGLNKRNCMKRYNKESKNK